MEKRERKWMEWEQPERKKGKFYSFFRFYKQTMLQYNGNSSSNTEQLSAGS